MKFAPEFITFSRAFLVWVLASFIILAGIDRILMPLIAGSFKRTVEVPELKTFVPEEAEKILKQIGLTMIMDTLADYSQEVEAGKIIKTRPVAAAKVKKGRRIWVTISKGLKQLSLPELKGFSIRQSEITLQQMGLKLGEIIWTQNGSIPVGVIYGSEPAAGTVVEPYSIVNLLASSGRGSAKKGIPKFVGMSLGKTRTLISQLNLKLGKIEYKQTDDKLPSTVMVQHPSPGVPISSGTMVDLVISRE